MNPENLREYKRRLRQEARTWRCALTPEEKAQMDADVLANVLRLRQYEGTGRLFLYVSTPMEVGTRLILTAALAAGKEVAVPRCIPGTREMAFHLITSPEELRPGAFGVEEPPATAPIADKRQGGFMLVPALRIDRAGYRLGYGKGYYDRYLVGFTGQTAGLCYSHDFVGSIRHGRFDQPVDIVVTERGICSLRTK